jgi:hypothetical protein
MLERRPPARPQTPACPPQAAVLDEAHRLKSRTSATRQALEELNIHWRLLLSGTPVQNNMKELQVGAGVGGGHPPAAGLRFRGTQPLPSYAAPPPAASHLSTTVTPTPPHPTPPHPTPPHPTPPPRASCPS